MTDTPPDPFDAYRTTGAPGGARAVRDVADLLDLLDGLFADGADRWSPDGAAWWDGFYGDARPAPFVHAGPDENLVAWSAEGLLPAPGRALDVGAGTGRNAVWLAANGWTTDAVDLSARALRMARDRVDAAGPDVAERLRLVEGDALHWGAPEGGYDLVVDSGCFHHLPPHRRISYLALLERALRPGGAFVLGCFAAGRMGAEEPDAHFYRTGSLEGGLAYTRDDLVRVFADLEPVRLRPMEPQPEGSATFGVDFLQVALFRRPT